jgi:hypothetical protein
MLELLCQPMPLSLKASLDLFEARKLDRGHFASKVTVMIPVSRVISQNAAVVARIDSVIYIREVVPGHPALPINPNLAPQHSASLRGGQIEPLIDGLAEAISHDL